MTKPILDDELWALIEPLLPPPRLRRHRYPGRKPLDNRAHGHPVHLADRSALGPASSRDGVTSAASVLATWSLICARYPVQMPAALEITAPLAAPVAPAAALALSRRRSRRSDASHLLMQVVAGRRFSARDIDTSEVHADVAQALGDRRSASAGWRLIAFVDDADTQTELHLAHAACNAPLVFRGSYLFSGASLVAKEEFAAGHNLV